MNKQQTPRHISPTVRRTVLQESAASAIQAIGEVLASIFSTVRLDGEPRRQPSSLLEQANGQIDVTEAGGSPEDQV